jgi:hypothetical protein
VSKLQARQGGGASRRTGRLGNESDTNPRNEASRGKDGATENVAPPREHQESELSVRPEKAGNSPREDPLEEREKPG